MNDLLETLRCAEVELHQPRTRRDRSRVASLLHESFVEFGRSGTCYDRNAILNNLAEEEEPGRVLSQDFAVTKLGTDAALLTYKSAIVDDANNIHRCALRSSIWVNTSDGWKLQFHQATATDVFTEAV